MITNEDICRINACLRKQFSKADLVLQSHSLRQDYKADNLDFVELAMSLEEEFKVDIESLKSKLFFAYIKDNSLPKSQVAPNITTDLFIINSYSNRLL